MDVGIRFTAALPCLVRKAKWFGRKGIFSPSKILEGVPESLHTGILVLGLDTVLKQCIDTFEEADVVAPVTSSNFFCNAGQQLVDMVGMELSIQTELRIGQHWQHMVMNVVQHPALIREHLSCIFREQ